MRLELERRASYMVDLSHAVSGSLDDDCNSKLNKHIAALRDAAKAT